MSTRNQRIINVLLMAVTIAFIGTCFVTVATLHETQRGPAAGNIRPLGDYYVNRVVRLVRTNATGGKDTFCSAVVIGKHHLATAYHCLQGFMPIVEVTEDGVVIAGKPPMIEIRKADDHPTKTFLTLSNVVEGEQRVDYVVIQGDFKDFEVQTPVSDPYTLYKNIFRGSPVTVCGFPMGHGLFCERLSIYGLMDFQIQVIGQVLPGMSGGPGFLDDGTVISVTSSVQGGTSLLSPLGTIPADSVK